MLLRIMLLLSVISIFPNSAQGQSVLVCTLETESAVVKQNESGGLTTEVVKGKPETLIFANFDTGRPILKIGSLEFQLELLHTDGDTFWLRGSTPDFIGNGISIWMIDRKSRMVVRSETFKLKGLPSQSQEGRLVGLSSIGKCQ